MLNYINSIPLHIQLKERLEKKIVTGDYKGKIPSERELMEEYYVSRSTVRQAVDQLVRDGILEKRRGKGTYVVLKPIQDWLGTLSSTTETIERMGMKPGAKLVDTKILKLSGGLVGKLGIDCVYCFKRIRYANDIPIGIENNYYPIHIGKALSNYNLNEETFYELLEKRLGIKIDEAEQLIKSGKVNKEDAKLLGISPNIGVLITERKLFDIKGNFIEYEEAFYRSDMYNFKVKLSRKTTV